MEELCHGLAKSMEPRLWALRRMSAASLAEQPAKRRTTWTTSGFSLGCVPICSAGSKAGEGRSRNTKPSDFSGSDAVVSVSTAVQHEQSDPCLTKAAAQQASGELSEPPLQSHLGLGLPMTLAIV